LNYEIEIVDINPGRTGEIFKFGEIPTYKVDIEQESLPIAIHKYDLILMNEVLEHLRLDPLKIFSEVKKVSNPSGFFYISIPNITPLMRFRFLFGIDFTDDLISEFEKIQKIGHMGHFRIFSISEIQNILKYFNFKPIKISYGGNFHSTGNKLVDKIFQYVFREKMKKQVHIIAQNN
jgi:SAM-dependent methyltransferase